MTQSKTPLFIACMLLCTFLGLSIDLLIPGFSSLKETLGIGNPHCQLTISIFLIAYSICQLFYGVSSDYFGRQRTALIGITLFVIGSTGCMLASQFNWLLVFRFIQGMGAGSAMISSFAIANTHYHQDERKQIIGNLSVSLSIVPMLLAFSGGLLASYIGWQAIFGFAALYAFLTIIYLYYFLPEDASELQTQFHFRTPINDSWKILSEPRFQIFTLISGLNLTTLITLLASIPLLSHELGSADPKWQGLFIGLNSLAIAAGSYLFTKISPRCSNVFLIYVASAFIISGLLLLSNAQTTESLYTVLYIASFGVGIITPAARYSLLQPFSNCSGQASSLSGFCDFSIAALSTSILALGHNTRASLLTLTIGAALLIVIFNTIHYRQGILYES